MTKSALRFLLNGDLVTVADPTPTETLLDWLREAKGLTAAKEGCREGDCGACTVVLGRAVGGRLRLQPVNACLVLLPMVDGGLVITLEGLTENGRLHPVQQALIEHHGSQCGFCTPGIAISLFALHHAGDGADAIDEALGGNLCRCTGYRSIVAAANALGDRPPVDRYARDADDLVRRLEALARTETLALEQDRRRWFTPVNLDHALALMAAHPEGRLVAGATDLGLEVTKQYRPPATLIALDRVPALKLIEEDGDGVVLGAAVTYAEALPAFDRLAPALGRLVRRIGGRQIRALGTIGGNLANASPIGDLLPPLLVLGAEVRLRSAQGARTVPMTEFLTGYRQTALVPGELIEAVRLPRPPAGRQFYAYKIAKRYEQDITTVSAAFLIALDEGRVTSLAAAYGGMAPTARRVPVLEAALTGQPWTPAAIAAARPALAVNLVPIDDLRASAAYRIAVAGNLLLRLHLETTAPEQPAEVMAL